jgi:RNA polymerase sigma-70 factor (ECF subfamily)
MRIPGTTPASETSLDEVGDDAHHCLIDRVRAGDAEALRTLLERSGAEVWSAIDREIGPTWRSLVDADDVMQVTYLEAFLHAADIRGNDEPAFASWLHRIARNNLQDAIKELQRKKRPSPALRVPQSDSGDSYQSLVELLGTTTSTPSRHVARQEASAAIEAALARMPAAYANVIRLYELEERDIDEVAAALGRSRGAIYMLKARAHELLRGLLGAETDFFSRTM